MIRNIDQPNNDVNKLYSHCFDQRVVTSYNRAITHGLDIMEKLVLEPIRNISGELHLPGSKSLSNRLLLLSALSKGQTEVYNVLDSDDTSYMLQALNALGIRYDISNDLSLIHI